EFGAAVLGFRDVAALAETLELVRVGHADAIDVARGNAGRAREPDEERVQVCAFASEVARLEQRADVAEAAPAHLGIAERVVDDPLVDRLGFLEVRAVAARDLA